MIEISANTKLAGILGKPVSHSLSPRLHGYLAEQTETDMRYLAFCVDNPDKLKKVLEGACEMGILGFNITSPYKVDAYHLADELDEEAKMLGNVNTLVNRDGKWLGYNTDGEGFIRSLKRRGIHPKGKHILLMGTGGTARTMSYKFAQNGAASITVLSRKEDPLAEIRPMTAAFPELKLYHGLDKSMTYDIMVNCTPLGMEPYEDKNPAPADFSYDGRSLCCDLIYNPAKTLFLAEAEKAGVPILNGLPMLLYQGVLAFEHFTGKAVSEELCDGLFRYFTCK